MVIARCDGGKWSEPVTLEKAGSLSLTRYCYPAVIGVKDGLLVSYMVWGDDGFHLRLKKISADLT